MVCASLCAACGSKQDQFVETTAATGGASDAGSTAKQAMPDAQLPGARCGMVEIDGEVLVDHEQHFTARFAIGAAYEKTLMLFGGDTIVQADTLGSAYIYGLDKQDALMLAQKYPDFYLCSSPGGMEASKDIALYNLVPADCDVYDKIVTALKAYDVNVAKGGDRTSLVLDAAPLQLQSVIEDATGNDVTSQVKDSGFNLVTGVQQITGQSVLSFGTSSH